MALIHTHFFSNTIGMNVSCDVIIPQKATKQIGVESSEREKIPVLWLLHGGSDDQTQWQRRTSIERYVEPLGIAVVMPFTEFAGYRNQAHGSSNYYDYIAHELPGIMHDFFGFSLDREDNYICGMSMGGNGALKFGMANPEQYSAIGCFSAGFFDHFIPEDTMHVDPQKDWDGFMRYDHKVIEGSEEDMLNNARRIISEGKPVPRVFHSTGAQDHILQISNKTKAFFESFEGNPFDYVYEEHPGKHNWEYWDVHIQRFLEYVVNKK